MKEQVTIFDVETYCQEGVDGAVSELERINRVEDDPHGESYTKEDCAFVEGLRDAYEVVLGFIRGE